jgi:zinc transport system substrate-binding protein/iron/zinc/copper transport system substrate-binding protein
MAIALFVAGCGKEEKQAVESTKSESTVTVVASTSWEAMYAKAAGVKEVTILAPVEMKHPMEYDFKPSDIEKVNKADLVLYSEYEPFMGKIFESATIDQDKRLALMIENTPDNIKAQVAAIAEKLNTGVDLTVFNKEVDDLYQSIQEKASTLDASARKVVVQAYMVPVAKSLGLEVIGVFGPEEVTAAKVTELANAKPALVIDNFHMPAGAEIAKVANVSNIEFRNFPKSDDQTLLQLIKENAELVGLQ